MRVTSSVDIGAKKIKVCITQINKNEKHSLIGYGEAPHNNFSNGQIVDIGVFKQRLNNAITLAESLANHKISNCNVNISGKNVLYKEISIQKPLYGRKITSGDLAKIKQDAENKIDTEKYSILFSNIKRAVIDQSEFDKEIIGLTGEELMVTHSFIYAPSLYLDTIRSLFNSLKIKLNKFVPTAYASNLTCLNDSDRELGALMIDFGAKNTDFVFIKEKSVQCYGSIPFGADNITRDIASVYELEHKDAEYLKKIYGKALVHTEKVRNIQIKDKNNDNEIKLEIPDREVSEISSARMDEIIQIIKLSIEKSGINQVNRIKITGGGANLKHLTQSLQFRFEGRVQICQPQKNLISTSNILNLKTDETHSSLLGLALYREEVPKRNSFLGFSFSGSSKREKSRAERGRNNSKSSFIRPNMIKSMFEDNDEPNM